jgi:rhodanese-related sulfurtransferase
VHLGKGSTVYDAAGGVLLRVTTMIEIDREDVQRLIGVGAQLVDVLPRQHYDEEHIPGAINIPLGRLGKEVGRLPRDRAVIVYCHDSQ